MTATETISEKTKLKKPPKWWVKFNTENGRIIRVSSNQLTQTDSKTEIIETEDASICKRIISGKLSPRQVGVVLDLETEQWQLSEKTDTLILKELSTRLYKISDSDPTKSDIHIKIYKNTNTVEISVNMANIKASMNLSDIVEVGRTEHALFNLYFTQKNNPDYFIKCVEVEPVLLFKQHSIVIKLEDLDLDWDKISVFTRPIFKKYSLEVLEYDVTEDIVFESRQIIKQVINDRTPRHLQMTYTNGMLVINSAVGKKNKYLFESKKFLHFIVCDSIIDNVVGGFEVPTSKLLEHNTTKMYLDFEMPKNPLIVYRSDALVVNYVGV